MPSSLWTEQWQRNKASKMQKFFENRWFLLTGLFLSIVIPSIVINEYIESSLPIEYIVSNQNLSTPSVPIEPLFDFVQLAFWIYLVGFIFFFGKLGMDLFSLIHLLHKHPSHSVNSFTYIETNTDLAPFSFFKWIVYNPNQFSNQELNLVLKHEKIHAVQGHSIDVIFAQLACAVLWFNPLVWLYKKALQQNLEFIADSATQTNLTCKKNYQNLLLKTSISKHTLSVTNTFYNSLIKKRIVMLHKSKSKKVNAFKYALVFPLLVLFVFNFNTEVVAQTKEPQQEKTKTAQNVLKYVITKDTKDTQLESIKSKLAENKATITFENVQRNDRHELIDIKINYEYDGKTGVFFRKSEIPIADIAISFNEDSKELSVGETKQNLSQSFVSIEEDGETKLKEEEDGNTVIVFSTDDDEKDNDVKVVGKDGDEHSVKTEKQVYIIKSNSTKNNSTNEDESVFMKKNKKDTVWIKSDVKNIVWTDDEGNVTQINASEKRENSKIFANNDDKKPLIFIDGKTVLYEELSKMKPDNIASMNVFKGEDAIKKYGVKGKDGVIYITTKDDASLNGANQTIAVGGATIGTKKEASKKDNSNPWAIKMNVDASDEKSKKGTGPWEISPTMQVTSHDIENDVTQSYNSSYISKDTRDKDFETIKKQLKTEGVTFNYSKLSRNKNGDIVHIKVEISTGKDKNRSGTFTNENGISTLFFGINNGKLFLNQSE